MRGGRSWSVTEAASDTPRQRRVSETRLERLPGRASRGDTLRLKRIQGRDFIPPSRIATRVMVQRYGLVRRDPKGKRRCRLSHPPRPSSLSEAIARGFIPSSVRWGARPPPFDGMPTLCPRLTKEKRYLWRNPGPRTRNCGEMARDRERQLGNALSCQYPEDCGAPLKAGSRQAPS